MKSARAATVGSTSTSTCRWSRTLRRVAPCGQMVPSARWAAATWAASATRRTSATRAPKISYPGEEQALHAVHNMKIMAKTAKGKEPKLKPTWWPWGADALFELEDFALVLKGPHGDSHSKVGGASPASPGALGVPAGRIRFMSGTRDDIEAMVPKVNKGLPWRRQVLL